jgi:predicted metal-binding transcription factor (methanogenesis marker protein 9)
VTDIFIYLLDKGSDSEDLINGVLYETDLVKRILDTYRDNHLSTTHHTVTSGYMAFIRKLANKLLAVSKKQEEVVNFLDSIPEWSEFVSSHLEKRNEIEAKQLGNKK